MPRSRSHLGELPSSSVPSAFGALILKAAAYQADTRERMGTSQTQ